MSDDAYGSTGEILETKDYERVKDLLAAAERAGNVRFSRVEIWPLGVPDGGWKPKIVITAGHADELEIASELTPIIVGALNDTFGQLLKVLVKHTAEAEQDEATEAHAAPAEP